MKAGVDFGSSLVKAVWMNDGQFRFSSTADVELEEIARQLSDDGVKKIHLAGIGYSDDYAKYLKDFEVITAEGDPITQEKKLQVRGAKELMRSQGENIRNFILVLDFLYKRGRRISFHIFKYEKFSKSEREHLENNFSSRQRLGEEVAEIVAT